MRFPTRPPANPYLAFSAMLAAGLDGIENKINPGEPAEEGFSADLERKKRQKSARCRAVSTKRCATSVRDHRTSASKGGVFSKDLIEAWIGFSAPRGRSIPCGYARRIHTSMSYVSMCGEIRDIRQAEAAASCLSRLGERTPRDVLLPVNTRGS